LCTVIVSRRPGHDWPLIIAANRDEMVSRAWRAPGRHWPDRPEVIAGLDEQAGGSWMGMNDFGVVAAILNRSGTLGSLPGKRSRGELVLDALDHADAASTAAMLADLDPDAYRPFNLIVADNTDCFWLAHRGSGPIRVVAVPEGVSMITEGDLDDHGSSRVDRYLEQFRASAPDGLAFDEWARLLTDRADAAPTSPYDSMSFTRGDGFGTICHSLVALPAPGLDIAPVWRFAAATTVPPAWEHIQTR
jgi:uncharacterized protein with NRDE domain